MLGGILLAQFSDSEIKRLVEELDAECVDELRAMLLAMSSWAVPRRDYSYDLPPSSDLAVQIFEKVKSRRLSKDKVIGYMRDIDPEVVALVQMPGTTLRELIEGFLVRAGSEGGNRLLGRVSGVVEQDPYLQGISERR
jgi:hypothetical protein